MIHAKWRSNLALSALSHTTQIYILSQKKRLPIWEPIVKMVYFLKNKNIESNQSSMLSLAYKLCVCLFLREPCLQGLALAYSFHLVTFGGSPFLMQWCDITFLKLFCIICLPLLPCANNFKFLFMMKITYMCCLKMRYIERFGLGL